MLAPALPRRARRELGRAPLALSAARPQRARSHAWPGNVRELEHVIEYAAAAAPDNATELEPWHLPATVRAPSSAAPATPLPVAAPAPIPPAAPGDPRRFRPISDEVRELERNRMIAAMRETRGVQNRAAELIEMPLRTFVTKLKRYAIVPSDWT